MTRRLVAALLCAGSMAAPALGQTVPPETAPQASDAPALLVADSVTVEGNRRLVANGNVEALFDGATLQATSVVYDQASDTLLISGPIRITYPDGTLILSDAAELDQGLRNGLLRGARLVLDEQLQLAAVEAQRVDGRYTQLSRVAVTSCQVCAGETPLWQIRASRVIHDQQDRQIYMQDAQVRVLDVPVLYLPRLRLPDPTLKRARGFLIPTLESSSLLGFGIKVPYFVPLGDHADITFTPYLSRITTTLEYRYRQAFAHGDIEINGAFSRDTVREDDRRAYAFAEGTFDLPRDFKLEFDVKLTSDASYLSDYDYSDEDRLESRLTVYRVKRDELIQADLIHYESLIEAERNGELPSIVADGRYERRFVLSRGGELRFNAVGSAHHRYSTDDVVGRDVARLHASVGYLNRWTLPGGLRAGVQGWLHADRIAVREDSTSDPVSAQLTPQASVELRWPFVKRGANGARVLLEPVAQIGWTGADRINVANAESTRVEFDEANLLSLSRFPALDRRERGAVGALGLRWLREDPRGWGAGLTVGRVWREDADASFTRSSGLDSTASDWLIAGHVENASGLSLMARGLWQENLRFSKAEARATYTGRKWDITAAYVLLGQDAAENRADAISEWTFDGSYAFADNWTASTKWRYDLANDSLARGAFGLTYANECVEVDFSVSRRFTSSANVEASTKFGLTVALKGFSTGGSAKTYRRSCG